MLVLSLILFTLSVLFFILYIQNRNIVFKIFVYILFILIPMILISFSLIVKMKKDENHFIEMMSCDNSIVEKGKYVKCGNIISLNKYLKVYEVVFINNNKEFILYYDASLDCPTFVVDDNYTLYVSNNIISGYEVKDEDNN